VGFVQLSGLAKVEANGLGGRNMLRDAATKNHNFLEGHCRRAKLVDMRKILLPILFVAFGASVGFSQTFIDGEWSYTLNESNEATITSYSGAGGAVVIPASVGGFPVKTVGGGGSSPIFGWSDTSVTSVTIPDSVTSIGEWAFAYSSLTSVTIGNGVTSIGEWAFAYSSLTSVTIGNGVTSIGDYAFSGCTSLTNVTIPDSVTGIGEWAFSYCTSLTSLNIGNGVTSIGDNAFHGCTSLTSVTIGNGVTSIGEWAFSYCTSLTSVTIIPNLLLSIKAQAFQNGPMIAGPVRVSVLSSIDPSAFADDVVIDRDVDVLVKAVAEGIVATLPDNYGIATKADLGEAISSATTQAIAQVQAAPNEYNLYDSTQYEANRIIGVAEGKAEVTSNPASYNLFTPDSIMDLRMGGMMIQKQGGNAIVSFQPQTTTDLATQPFADNGPAITSEIPMPGDKGFLRIQAKPE